MYLDYFKLKEMPFSLTPNVSLFCNLRGHQEALNVLQFSLRSGEGFIKIIGEVGAGKTLLCRKLLDSLNEEFVTAYIPNPDLEPTELRKALARELGIDPTHIHDQHELLTQINHTLLQHHHAGKRVVLLLDEAQALPLESLEAVRLLTNLETEKTKLLQVVLFGQPELDEHLNKPTLRQLKQRITFSYHLPLMTREDLDTYLFHRLSMAGYTLGTLFTKRARKKIYLASKGVPRIVNIICHKALLAAYGRGEFQITPKLIRHAIQDTEVISSSENGVTTLLIAGLGILLGAAAFYFYFQGMIG